MAILTMDIRSPRRRRPPDLLRDDVGLGLRGRRREVEMAQSMRISSAALRKDRLVLRAKLDHRQIVYIGAAPGHKLLRFR